MGQFVNLERPWSFFDASGNKYWSGVMLTGQVIEVYNAEASATIAAGEPVKVDAATSVWSRWDLSTTADAPKQVIGAKRTGAAAELGVFGVAGENILAGKVGRVFGRGSWVAVKCKNPPAANTVGAAVISDSGTAGQVDTVQSGAGYSQTIAHVKAGLILGFVMMPAGTGAGQTGSTTQLGVDVNPQ